jgi:hypothetical protein
MYGLLHEASALGSVLAPRRFAADGKLLEVHCVPAFPATLRWTLPRVRLSTKESRMKLANDTNLVRKFRGYYFPGPSTIIGF